MSEDPIVESHTNGITAFQLNRPDIGNRVSDVMASDLAAAIQAASSSSTSIVIKGQGDDFCLGREVFGQKLAGREAYDHREEIGPIFDLYAALRNSEVPTIAVVQGRATGFGCALAAVADITLAADSARFQFPEMGHQIMPTMAMSSIADRIGLKALMYLIYSTDEIDAERAQNIGLISKVVPSARLEEETDAFLEKISSAPLSAVKAVKEYAQAVQMMSSSVAADFAKNLHSVINTSSTMLNEETE